VLFYEIFLNIRDITLEASIFALVVMVLRLIFKKAPKWVSCFMWALVAIRLVVPFYFFEIPVDYIPDTPIVSEQTSSQTEPPAEVVKPDNRVDNIISDLPLPDRTEPTISESVVPEVEENLSADKTETKFNWEYIDYAIWLSGVCIMLLYAVISYIRLRRRVRTATPLKENQWICDEIKSPFILGFIKPRIYLPSSLQDETLRHVISHEKAHLKRKDYLWKPFGFILLSLSWFNPIMWISFTLFCRDIELACDEKVIKEMNLSDKKAYSEALLSCSSSHKLITACPVAFGEIGVKQRIKSVLNYKKPACWVIIVAVIVSIVVAIYFMTDTKEIVTDNTTNITNEDGNSESDTDLKELWLKKDVWRYNPSFSTYGYQELHLYVDEKYEITDFNASVGTVSEITFEKNNAKLNGIKWKPENGEADKISITISTLCKNKEIDFNITLTKLGADGPTTFYQLSAEDKNFSRIDAHYRYIFDEEEIDISDYTTEPVLLADKIPNTPDWQTNGIASAGLEGAFAESVTEFSSGKVYLLSVFLPSENYRHQYLAVETESHIFFEDVDVSYGSQIYLCDVDGTAGEEIILNQMVGAAGGGGAYNSSVYRITENGLQLIYYSSAVENSSGFESKLEAPFTVRITNRNAGYELLLDFKGESEFIGTVFDEEGDPVDVSGASAAMFDSFLSFAPVDIDADGVYEIECLQYTSLYSHVDFIGLARSVLKYNENTGKFDVVVAEFTPDLTEDVPESYWDFNPYASAEFHYVTQFVLPDGYEIKSAEVSDGTATYEGWLYNRPDGSECVKWTPGFYEDGTSKETDLTIKAVKDGKDIEFKIKITEVYDESYKSDLSLKTYKITPVNCKMRVVTTSTYYLEEK